MLVVETAPINIHNKLRSQLSAFQVSLWVKMSIIAGKNIQDLTMASDTSSNEVGNRISLTSILVTIVGFISLSVCSSPHSQFVFLFSRNICTSTHGSTSEAPFLCRFPGGPIARWLGIVFLAVNLFSN